MDFSRDWSSTIDWILRETQIERKAFKKTFFILLVLALIYTLPLIIGDIFYRDDNTVATLGSDVWGLTGRHLSGWLMLMLSFSNPFAENGVVFDLAPLPIILACILLSFSAALYASLLFKDKVNFYSALVVSPIIINPFFLQVLSFRYMSFLGGVYLALAVLALLEYKNRKHGIISGAIFLFIGLHVYQLVINVFIAGAAILFFVKFINERKVAFSYALDTLAKLLLATIPYSLLMRFYLADAIHYAISRSELLSLDMNGLNTFIANQAKLLGTVVDNISTHFVAPFILIVLAAFVLKIFLMKSNSLEKIYILFAYIITNLILIFSTSGVCAFCKSLVWAPRVYVGFGFVLILAFYLFLESFGSWFAKSRILLLIPIVSLVVLAYAYGSGLREQYRSFDSKSSRIMNMLEDLGAKEDSEVIFDGFSGFSIVAKVANRDKFVHFLLTRAGFTINSNSLGSAKEIFTRKDYPFKRVQRRNKKFVSNHFCKNSQLLYSSPSFKIFIKGKKYLVSFPERGACFNYKKAK